MANNRKGFVLWLTGLSGSGKTTIARELELELAKRDLKIEVLDGDEIRTNLSQGLGFSKADRDTNIRRIGYVSRLLARNGVTVITAAISPYRAARDEVKKAIRDEGLEFVEIFVSAPIETLIGRDVKGLYKKALAGEIEAFTGVSDPYEEPFTPNAIVRTDTESIIESVSKIIRELERHGLVSTAKNRSTVIGNALSESYAI
jgi:adenylylsulfate kinase